MFNRIHPRSHQSQGSFDDWVNLLNNCTVLFYSDFSVSSWFGLVWPCFSRDFSLHYPRCWHTVVHSVLIFISTTLVDVRLRLFLITGAQHLTATTYRRRDLFWLVVPEVSVHSWLTQTQKWHNRGPSPEESCPCRGDQEGAGRSWGGR